MRIIESLGFARDVMLELGHKKEAQDIEMALDYFRAKGENKFFEYLLPDGFRKNEKLFSLWKEWVKYRKEIKKSLTERSVKMQVKFLAKQKDPIETIEKAIRNRWRGLY